MHITNINGTWYANVPFIEEKSCVGCGRFLQAFGGCIDHGRPYCDNGYILLEVPVSVVTLEHPHKGHTQYYAVNIVAIKEHYKKIGQGFHGCLHCTFFKEKHPKGLQCLETIYLPYPYGDAPMNMKEMVNLCL